MELGLIVILQYVSLQSSLFASCIRFPTSSCLYLQTCMRGSRLVSMLSTDRIAKQAASAMEDRGQNKSPPSDFQMWVVTKKALLWFAYDLRLIVEKDAFAQWWGG